MTDAEVLAKVIAVVRDQLDNDEILLTKDTKASSVEDWDSLAHVRIMVAIEEEFGIRFGTTEIASLKDVGSLIALIQAKL